MKQDELDHILVSEKQIEPSNSFTETVMNRIQTENMRFPWIRFALATAVVAILSFAYFPSEAVLHAEFALWSRMSGFFEVSMDETLRDAILYVFASLSGTMFLVWASFRLAGGSR